MLYFIKLFSAVSLLLLMMYTTSFAQSAKDIRGAAAVVPIENEPAPKLIVDQPLPEQLAYGRVIIQYRTENLRIVPVYGVTAKEVSPRIGHLHITVDDATWHWADAGNEPLILNGFTPGTHHVLFELADPLHSIITSKTITFVVPAVKDAFMQHH